MKSTTKALRPHTCMDCRAIRTCVVIGLAYLALTDIARAQFQFVAWGDNTYGQCNVPGPTLPGGLSCVELAAGGWHTVARRNDGSAVVWGYCGFGQCGVPALPAGLIYVDVAAGGRNTMARRNDGSVIAWGDNSYGQCNVPPLPSGLTYVKSDLGGLHSVALRSDGSAVAWGYNGFGQCNVPALPPGQTYVDVAAGGLNTMLLLSNGSIMWLGDNSYGQCNVPPLPGGPTYVMIDPGGFHTVALISNGSVVAWGDNTYGQCNVPPPPLGLTCVEVAGGGFHTVARYGLAATVASIGIGCGGAGMPAFSCNTPRIGHNVTLSLTLGTPNASGSIYYSTVGPTDVDWLGSGCLLAINLPTAAPFIPIVTNPAGSWGTTLAIPPNPTLVGVQAAMQIALFGTAAPFGIDLSNGLMVILGY